MTSEDRLRALAENVGLEVKLVRSEVAAGGVVIQGELDALSDVVATKASNTDVTEALGIVQDALTGMNTQIASKASDADLTAAVGQIDALSDAVATKANSSDVTAQLAGKANAADLDNVFTIATGAVPKTTTVAGKPLSSNVTIDKSDVGLGSVDNTSDAAKPISTATATALTGKAPLNSPAFTGTPTGITKTHVGLGNVDNTADSTKPVSTAQAAAIAAKVNTADVAGLATVGWGRAVFIANGGTVPAGTPPYTIVIEASA